MGRLGNRLEIGVGGACGCVNTSVEDAYKRLKRLLDSGGAVSIEKYLNGVYCVEYKFLDHDPQKVDKRFSVATTEICNGLKILEDMLNGSR